MQSKLNRIQIFVQTSPADPQKLLFARPIQTFTQAHKWDISELS